MTPNEARPATTSQMGLHWVASGVGCRSNAVVQGQARPYSSCTIQPHQRGTSQRMQVVLCSLEPLEFSLFDLRLCHCFAVRQQQVKKSHSSTKIALRQLASQIEKINPNPTRAGPCLPIPYAVLPKKMTSPPNAERFGGRTPRFSPLRR